MLVGGESEPQFLTLNVMNLHLIQGLQLTRLKHPKWIYQNCARGLQFLQTPLEQWGDVTGEAKFTESKLPVTNMTFERLKL